MKRENQPLTLETLEFIVRHPWFFIYPFVLVLVVTFAYVASVPPKYECRAVVSFRVSGQANSERSIQRKDYLLANVLYGENIKNIVKNVWPGMSEISNPIRYNLFMNALRNPKSGIIIQFDRRDSSLVTISFTSRIPVVCNKIVQATIDVMRIENRRADEETVGSTISFLTNQLDLYKNKLAAVDSEMVKVSTKLKEMAEGLNVEQRELVHRITSELVMQQQYNDRAIMGEARNTDVLADLEMKLVEAKRNKQLVEMRIKNKDFTPVRSESQTLKEDIYEKAIEEKKRTMFTLISKGYLPEHPMVKQLKEGIKDLEAYSEEQAQVEAGRDKDKLSEKEKKLIENKMRGELEDINFAIDTLDEKKKVMEGYKKASERAPAIEEALVGPVAAEASKLRGLRDEKEMIIRYYNDLRKQVEDADLRGRADKSSAGFIIDVVEPPNIPLTPVHTSRLNYFMLGLMVAVGLGAACSYLADSLDTTVKSPSELREELHIPVLASIDMMQTPAMVKLAREQSTFLVVALIVLSVVSMGAVKAIMIIINLI